MYCSQCGAKLLDGAKFCTKCGKELNMQTQGEYTTSATTGENEVEGTIPCPICGNMKCQPFYRGRFKYYKCSSCDLEFRSHEDIYNAMATYDKIMLIGALAFAIIADFAVAVFDVAAAITPLIVAIVFAVLWPIYSRSIYNSVVEKYAFAMTDQEKSKLRELRKNLGIALAATIVAFIILAMM